MVCLSGEGRLWFKSIIGLHADAGAWGRQVGRGSCLATLSPAAVPRSRLCMRPRCRCPPTRFGPTVCCARHLRYRGTGMHTRAEAGTFLPQHPSRCLCAFSLPRSAQRPSTSRASTLPTTPSCVCLAATRGASSSPTCLRAACPIFSRRPAPAPILRRPAAPAPPHAAGCARHSGRLAVQAQ